MIAPQSLPMPAASVLSFPERGPWGSARWRGNASGHLYRALFGWLHPTSFCDPMMGSGTGVEAARELGIETYGLDLSQGFNILRKSIRDTIGKEVDLCFSHPPYHDMIGYSGEVWGKHAHPDDLSRCESVEDFLAKLQVAVLNQREAVVPGGFYGILIGDQRRAGRYYSFQGEMIGRLPREELSAVLIKMQHNTQSCRAHYTALHAPRILHEYVLIWRRPAQATLLVRTLSQIAGQQYRALQATWSSVVKTALIELGGDVTLPELYGRVGESAKEHTAHNPHWQAKVRQTLQIHPDLFTQKERGRWALAA